ncbi:N-acetylmuramoyl-L-alanine amidase [Uliginosibacterium sp. H3]|uniref:N-acetylmuramoyl-L-alanine amidase n=1 Tax=Uliginosibacterium silvisoli TaxID=3114758 RepID=A0ABU6JZ62_9RHOO|nr:N-acetylmuramoyl-L-alanine amidase [Uliginosibacterium sp. H3]
MSRFCAALGTAILAIFPGWAAEAALIAVDTGHTPLRYGATAPDGRVEYQYNLTLSSAVSRELTAKGDQVFRISADGNEVELAKRATLAPDASLFVSIHHDSIQQAWIDAGRRREFAGFSLFVSEKNPHYAESLACAKGVAERLLAIGEMPSGYHATPIPGENRPFIDKRLGIHRFDDLVVLKTATMPALLIEAGVIANPDEARRLAAAETVDRLARAIAEGLHACQNPSSTRSTQ